MDISKYMGVVDQDDVIDPFNDFFNEKRKNLEHAEGPNHYVVDETLDGVSSPSGSIFTVSLRGSMCRTETPASYQKQGGFY